MTERRSRPSPHLRTATLCLLLAIITVSAFRPVLHNGFIDWDDRDEVANNPDFIHPSFQAITHYWAKPFRGLFIPLTYTTWGLIASVARSSPQLDAARFHLASVAVHAATTIVVFFLVRRLAKSELAAWFAAMVFAVHPMQVEAVAWVESFYTVLGGFFSLAALYAYLVFVDWRGQPRRGVAVWSIYAIATILYLAALLAKPSAVVVPLLAAVLAMLRHRPVRKELNERARVRARAETTLPSGQRLKDFPKRVIAHGDLVPLGCWLLLAAPISLVARMAQSGAVAYTTTWPMRVVVALDSITFYFYRLIVPIDLIPDYGRSPRWAQSHPWALLDVVEPLIIFAAAWFCRRRFRWVLASLAICVISLLPVLGFVPFSFQRYSTVADRYFYVGMLGPALLVGYLLAQRRSKIIIAAAGTAILVWALLSFAQSERWRDSQTLFDFTLSLNPQSAAANYVLGSITASAALQERAAAHTGADAARADGQISRAIGYYSQALQTDPTSSEVLFNLGNLYQRIGQLEPAVDSYERAVHGQAPTAEMWNNLGIALTGLGHNDEAAEAFASALQIDPLYADAEANWALLLLSVGDNRRAAAHFRHALTIRPDCAAAIRGLDRIRQAGVAL